MLFHLRDALKTVIRGIIVIFLAEVKKHEEKESSNPVILKVWPRDFGILQVLSGVLKVISYLCETRIPSILQQMTVAQQIDFRRRLENLLVLY